MMTSPKMGSLMVTPKNLVVPFLVPLLQLLLWLFLGVFTDREFGTISLFIKHRPTIKIFFSSPQGEADRSSILGHEGYLTPNEEIEELAYREFVREHKGYERSIKLF